MAWHERSFLGTSLFAGRSRTRSTVLHIEGLSPRLTTLHYPPADAKNGKNPAKTTVNPRNICINNILSKMGLSDAEDQMSLAWIERFFKETSLRWREQNETEQYRAAYAEDIVDLNLDPIRRSLPHQTATCV